MGKKRTRSENFARFNLVLTFVWIALLVPSLLLWKDSVPWLVSISVYANIVGHWSAYQGSRAGVAAENGNGDHPEA